MKLEVRNGNASGGKILETQKFGIGDVGVVMEIMRSKLYANPIKVICQEIASNARDAHREIGKDDVPIHIQLPSQWDMTYHIHDFGPGISPERMCDVFIQYGNSTKRNDNVQNGGFGIGAKCPWSYADMFTIISITPDPDGRMMCRQYAAEVSSSQEGTLRLLAEFETDQPQGTEIIIACKEGDTNEFMRWTTEACQFWTVKPIITGVSNFEWPTFNREFTGDKWFILAGQQRYHKVQPNALIDEICYPLNFDNMRLNELDDNTRDVLNKVFLYPIYLEFDVGDIPVAASREEIDYTDPAVAKIQEKLILLAKDIVEEISQQISKCSDLWEAALAWKSVGAKYRNLIGHAVWNGQDVDDEVDTRRSGMRTFRYNRNASSKGRYRSVVTSAADPGAFRATNYSNSFHISENVMVLYTHENFSKKPNRRKLRTIFQDYPDIDSVIVWTLPYVDDAVTDAVEIKAKQEKYDKVKKDMADRIALYNIGCFDDFDKAKIVRNKNGVRTKASKIWKYNPAGYSSRDSWIPDTMEIATGTGVYVILNRKCAYSGGNPNKIEHYHLKEMAALLDAGTILYGISKRQKSKIGPGWISLATYMTNKLTSLYSHQDYAKALCVSNASDNASNKLSNIWRIMQKSWATNVHNSTGAFAEYCRWTIWAIEKHSVFAKASNVRDHLIYRLGVSNLNLADPPKVAPTVLMGQLWKKVQMEYPLLGSLGYSATCDAVCDYVNMIDRKLAMNGEYIS